MAKRKSGAPQPLAEVLAIGALPLPPVTTRAAVAADPTTRARVLEAAAVGVKPAAIAAWLRPVLREAGWQALSVADVRAIIASAKAPAPVPSDETDVAPKRGSKS